MRLIDADAEIAKIEAEIERYKERIQQLNDNRTDRNLHDVDLKIRELERNITECRIEIKCIRRYETVKMDDYDKKIRDEVTERIASLINNIDIPIKMLIKKNDGWMEVRELEGVKCQNWQQ